MAQEYTIKAVGKTAKEWESKYGPMKTYLIQVEGNGEPVQLNKKADSPRPEAGDTIFGDITNTEFGQKFKAAQKPFNGGSKKPAYNENGQKHGAALKIAADFLLQNKVTANPDEFVDQVEKLAAKIFAIKVPVVAGESEQPKKDWIDPAIKEKILAAKKSNDELDAEMNSLINSEEPINLADIPF